MWRAFFFLLFVSGSLYSPFLIQRLTLGFHPTKLHPRLSFKAEWETPPLTAEQQEAVRKILAQPFTYFDLGSQAYVFKSQDDQYVLKLFRYNRSQFPLIYYLKTFFHKKLNFFIKMDKTFQACALAYQEVPECTQIVYTHFNPQEGSLPTVAISDPVGRVWRLPLGLYRFILQRKVDPFKSTLLRAYHSQNDEAIKSLLNSFLTLLYQRTGKLIRNSDHNLGPNFGFFHGQAIELDCGNYRKCPELSDPEMRIQEMKKFTVALFSWAMQYMPEYAPYFQQQALSVYEKVRLGYELSPGCIPESLD